MPKIPTNQEFDFLLKEIHGDKFRRLEDRISNQTNIRMWCERCQKEWHPRIRHLLNGFGCPNCQKIKTQQLDIKIQEIFNGNYVRVGEYNEIKGVAKQKIKMQCNICGNINEQRVSHILEGHGCWHCMRKNLVDSQRMSLEEFISRSKKINGDNTYDYSLIDNIINQNHKVSIVCKIHGKFSQSVSDHLHNKSGCPKCKESKGEKQIRIFLDSKNIEYTRNKTFNGCRYKKPLYFDFFLPKFNLCVEFDGRQHETGMIKYKGNRLSESEIIATLTTYKIRDKIKDEYCLNNNIRLLRINYRDYKNICNILNHYLFGNLSLGLT